MKKENGSDTVKYEIRAEAMGKPKVFWGKHIRTKPLTKLHRITSSSQ
jgi:hypothetical protein